MIQHKGGKSGKESDIGPEGLPVYSNSASIMQETCWFRSDYFRMWTWNLSVSPLADRMLLKIRLESDSPDGGTAFRVTGQVSENRRQQTGVG